MPTTYTHDLFGKEVYRTLPEELRKVIRRHGDLYRIGLHGPDILFYYHLWKNRVNRLGSQMHREPADEFFKRNLALAAQDGDEAFFVYLLGFSCHHLLDSVCHPYINSIEDEVSHTLIEKELDRRLMLKTGKNPYRYYPSCCIRPRYAYARTIHKAIPQITVPQIMTCLKLMKRYTDFMVYDDGGKKARFFPPVFKFFGHPSFGDHLMRESCEERCVPHLEKLELLYRQALKEAPGYLKLLSQWDGKTEKLPERLKQNYNGQQKIPTPLRD